MLLCSSDPSDLRCGALLRSSDDSCMACPVHFIMQRRHLQLGRSSWENLLTRKRFEIVTRIWRKYGRIKEINCKSSWMPQSKVMTGVGVKRKEL